MPQIVISKKTHDLVKQVTGMFDGVTQQDVADAGISLFAQLFLDDVLDSGPSRNYEGKYTLTATEFVDMVGISKQRFATLIPEEKYKMLGIKVSNAGTMALTPEACWNIAHELFELSVLNKAQAVMLLYRVQQLFVIKRAWINISLVQPTVGKKQWQKRSE